MPIIRGRHRFESHYTQIPNAWLRDKRLSYKARGLLAELLSHEPGFSVSRESLARNGQDGDRAVRSAIAELEAAGYLSRSQGRSEGSQKFGAAIWITTDPFDPSVQNEPSATSKSVHYPSVQNPSVQNAGAKKTIFKKIEVKKEDLVQNKFEPEQNLLFNEFWAVYPRRQGRGAALKAFEKSLDKIGGEVILDAAMRFARDPNLPPKQFIPMPATWLNQERWEDGPLPERELTPEEKQARARAESERRREIERRHAEQMRIESEEARRKSTPPPRCEHGNSIISCRTCLFANK